MMRRIFFNVEMKNRKKYQSLRGFPVSAYEVPGFSILRAITTKDTKDHEGNAISDVPSWTGACPERTRRMSFVVIALASTDRTIAILPLPAPELRDLDAPQKREVWPRVRR